MKITIKTILDGQEILAKVFGEGVYRVGRSEFSDIVLNHAAISRSHLEIRITESSVYLTNMSSGGKVKLNGQWVETAEVADGDEVRLGPFQIIVFHGERADLVPASEVQPNATVPTPPIVGEEEKSRAALSQAQSMPPPEEPGFVGAVVGSDIAVPMAQLEPEPAQEGTAMGRAETQLEIKPIVAKLLFSEGPRAGEELFIETFEVTIGRSKKADIYLDDEKLSRYHAKITRVGMGYRLVDMSSRNGTYVNGMRILEHPLNSFDEIVIGNSKIKFLIHDVMSNDIRGGTLAVVNTGSAPSPRGTQTRSLHQNALDGMVPDLEIPQSEGLRPVLPEGPEFGGSLVDRLKRRKNTLLISLIVFLGLIYLILPSKKGTNPSDAKTEATEVAKGEGSLPISPSIPKEFSELTPEAQRKVEGNYNAAIQAAQQGQYDAAVEYLQRIHQVLPFYKNSEELRTQYAKVVQEKRMADVQKRQKDEEKQDLAVYLEEGVEYLKSGDFGRAAEAFQSAIVIDPNNPTAARGVKAAEQKVKNLEEVAADKDEEQEKRKLVKDLFEQAVTFFTSKSYQQAIETAEKIRKIELRGDTQYLNEAKQIIDRARMLQKDEFEPFLIQAKEKYSEGDYNAARDLCEEMLKRDPAYEEAGDLLSKSKKQLHRLAKEAYTYGYILESMNRIEEAKQYWNRAKNYIRPGDEYHSKVIKKLDYYQ